MRLLTSAIAAALAMPLLFGCASPEATDSPSRAAKAEEPKAPKVDVLTQSACRHFRNVMGDIDVLSATELREKIKEVHDDARYSEDPGIPEGARAMLAAVTADNGEALLESVGEFSGACEAAGV